MPIEPCRLQFQAVYAYLSADAGKVVALNRWHRDWVKKAEPTIELRGKRMSLKVLAAIQKQAGFTVVGATLDRWTSKFLPFAEGCGQLRVLDAHGCFLNSLHGLQSWKGLLAADISHCDYITDLSAFQSCRDLHTIDLSFCARISTLAGLAGCRSLKTLNLRGCAVLEDVSGLSHSDVEYLDIAYCVSFVDVKPLLKCAHLKSVTFGGCKTSDGLDVSSLRTISVTVIKHSETTSPSKHRGPIMPSVVGACSNVSAFSRSSLAVKRRCRSAVGPSDGQLCSLCGESIQGVLCHTPEGAYAHWGCLANNAASSQNKATMQLAPLVGQG